MLSRVAVVLFVGVVVVGVDCFNLEVRNPIVKRGEKGSYFGYSVAEHITDKGVKWLLVGAPLGQNLQPRTNRSGALFKCPLTENSPGDCEQVETDGRRSSFDYDDDTNDEDANLSPPGADEIKDGQWMGVSVKSQKPGGIVMVCAHRYITGKNLTQTQHGLGLCYSLNSDLTWDQTWEPCKGRPMNSEHQQFGYCQAGTSLSIMPDGTALIGSPGPFTWRGTMFVIEVVGDFLKRDKNYYLGPLNDSNEPIDKYSYLGMSVTAGKFFNGHNRTYASGAPRSQDNGQVYFFDKFTNDVTMNIRLTITGESFASNFGYELLTVDINNDGYDDLLVAAPFYFNKTSGGAVYVYTNLRHCTQNNCPFDQKFTGAAESRFGFAMTSLGDINHDGYNDVAIGAPYEHPRGAIYVYLGGPDGLIADPSQKIKLNEGPFTLGYSLSGGVDLDDNGYPDLLTGAFDSDMVILFRARAIVHIEIDVRGKELRNIDTGKSGCAKDPDSTRTCFSFKACFKLKKPLKYKSKIMVQSFIEADVEKRKGKFARVRFNSTSESPNKVAYINIKEHQLEYCQDETVYIKETNQDILTPIKFKVSYSLNDSKPLSPIMNQTSVKEFVATFQKDCGKDDICQSDLRLTAGLQQLERREDDNVYLLDLGSVEEINVNVNVSNLGESAYEAQLFVNHSPMLSYIALDNKLGDIKCIFYNDTLVTCNLGNPFQSQKAVELGLRFESKDNSKMNAVKELEFFVYVNSTSEELSRQTSASFKVEVKKRAEVKITGAATSYTIFGGPVKGESAIKYFDEIGSRIWHRYQVSNEGPWTIENVRVYISWPLQAPSVRAQGKWLLYLEEMPVVEFEGQFYPNCIIEQPYIVNELNFTSRPGGVDSPPDNLMMPTDDIDPDMPGMYSQGNTRRRRRSSRDAYSTDACSYNDRNCTLDCSAYSAKCAIIACELPRLLKGNDATIQIKSRLWNTTLVEDFGKKDFVKIVSRARIDISDLTVEQDPTDDDAKAETTAYPETTVQDSTIPLWIYIAAVIAGILFFLIISFILYKVGFFKRNRVNDQTLTGNLRKADESQNLLNK